MKSMIEWFARNSVAANLLMFGIFALGVFTLWPNVRIPVEVTPETELDRISIRMQYRGATPAEVEESVVVRIEEAIQDLDGIERITSTANEGSASVTVEVESGFEPRDLLEDIKNRVDAIISFPDETERPLINIQQRRGWARYAITVVVAGDLTEHELKRLGQRVEDEVASLPGVSQVELRGVRPYEIGIEVSEEALRRYGLTFQEVARAVAERSVDMPAGTVRTEGGDILLRTKGRAYYRRDFEKIPVLSRPDGTYLTVGDIATVVDGFEEPRLSSRYNGKPAVYVNVIRVGDQNAMEIAETVRNYVEANRNSMPPGVELTYTGDMSRVVRSRLNTLTNSALWGGILVFIVLALFLRFSVAFWVFLGIPVAFMGALATMPYTGVTINITSLFAFILVLGIVVDDAIVTGENIYRRMRLGEEPLLASINGTKEIAIPVTFGIITTMVAFLPMVLMDNERAAEVLPIPLIILPVLFFSLVESKLILPAHLKHIHSATRPPARWNLLVRGQRLVARGLELFVQYVYEPVLGLALRRRYIAVSAFLGGAVLFAGAWYGGHIDRRPFPSVEGSSVDISLTMPLGTPIELTTGHIEQIEQVAWRIRDRYASTNDDGEQVSLIETITAEVGSRGQAHVGTVSMEVLPRDERQALPADWWEISNQDLIRQLRPMIGAIPGAEELSFRGNIGWDRPPINVELTGLDFDVLQDVADRIKERLATYEGVYDIADTFQQAKDEVKLSVKPEAELLGLTMADLGRQVRQAFYGQEVQRIPRERDDVRVLVRYPEEERRNLASLERMYIRTPVGREVPFSEVAEAEVGRGFSTIQRIDRRRAVNVTADIDEDKVPDQTMLFESIERDVREITANYPSVYPRMRGDVEQAREANAHLITSAIFIVFAIYVLLAIPFRSYLQPFIVMSVIPFGLIGAVLGHLIVGEPVSYLSRYGMLAVIGVVVNDSLVLVDYVNRHVKQGVPLGRAVRTAGGMRFRPILLTSLTTFAGVTPIILEQSIQARFLVPMAVSLGFGVLFATVVTLFLVPVNYLLIEDAKAFFMWLLFLRRRPVADLHRVQTPTEHEPTPLDLEPSRQ